MPFSKPEPLITTNRLIIALFSLMTIFTFGWMAYPAFPLWVFFIVPVIYPIIFYMEYGVNFFTRRHLHYEYYFLLKRFYTLKLFFFVASMFIILHQYQETTASSIWPKPSMLLFTLLSLIGISSVFYAVSSYIIKRSIKKRYEESYLSSLNLTYKSLELSGYQFNLHLLGNYSFFSPIDKESDLYLMVRGDTKNYMDRTEHSSWRRFCNILMFKPLDNFDVTTSYNDHDFVLRSLKDDSIFIEIDMSYMVFGATSRRDFLKWLLQDTNHFKLLEMYYA